MSHTKEEEEKETFNCIVEGINLAIENIKKQNYDQAAKRLKYVLREVMGIKNAKKNKE